MRSGIGAGFRTPGAEFGGSGAMALQAKGADVFQIAFAAAFDHRQDVIGVPQAFAAGFSGSAANSPIEIGLESRRAPQTAQLPFRL